MYAIIKFSGQFSPFMTHNVQEFMLKSYSLLFNYFYLLKQTTVLINCFRNRRCVYASVSRGAHCEGQDKG